MRRLSKGPKPPVLIANEGAWTDEYINDRALGEKRRRWAHTEVVDALRAETFRKCMYCEDLPESVTWLHVEHIMPKAKFAELVVDWSNLGFACPRCNVAKSDYYDTTDPVLNPFMEDPRDHLEFCGGLIRARHGSGKGYLSIAKMELAREGLCQQRMEQIEVVEALVRVWHLLGPGSAQDAVKEQIWDLARPASRFSVAIADHLRHIHFPAL